MNYRALNDLQTAQLSAKEDIMSSGSELNANKHVGTGSEDSGYISATKSLVQLFTGRTNESDIRETGSPIIIVRDSDFHDLTDPTVRKKIGLTGATATNYAVASREVLYTFRIKNYELFAEKDVFKNIWQEIVVAETKVKETLEAACARIAGEPSEKSDIPYTVKNGLWFVESQLQKGNFEDALWMLWYLEDRGKLWGAKPWWK